MQPYQEEYIANLNAIAVLTARKKPQGRPFEEYHRELLCDRHEAEALVLRNVTLLREGLFPVLDHLFEMGDKVLEDLREFAGRLLSGRDELDAGLFCQIHQALLSHARMKRDRSHIIEELYWLGIGRNSLCNKMVGLDLSVTEDYISQMRLCFIEAAAYLKYYDEIDDTGTRGYILRSLANRSLGQFKYHNEKIHLTRQTLEILSDREYQEKEPDLPWDRFIYMTHQQMTANISHSRERVMTPQDIADVMDSAYIVYQRRILEARQLNEKPPIRSAFTWHAINYYCGLSTLDDLLTHMEVLMDAADVSDFSPENLYGLISLPAFYCQYLTEYPEKIPERTSYIESLYRKILDYVEAFPEASESETLFFYLRQLSFTFLETAESISFRDFMLKLLIRFAPDIYIHSHVVGTAASVLCGVLFDEDPTFFDDIEFIKAIPEPGRKREAILAFALDCGIFHDAGKLNFLSFYTQAARQWFENEYEMAHLHTLAGENLLSSRASTSSFSSIALGHHSWYDGSRGYPASYHRLECPFRQMVDVIGLIDWFDNVTCTSRLFTGVEMTFPQALEAAISLEGRRFSPLLTPWLTDGKVAEQLVLALEQGRTEGYRQIYQEQARMESRPCR